MATARQKDRKARTLTRLEAVLVTGKKPLRIENKARAKGYSTSTTQTVPLTDQDRKRIGGEVNNLKKTLGLVVTQKSE